jgi:hypothetical protein
VAAPAKRQGRKTGLTPATHDKSSREELTAGRAPTKAFSILVFTETWGPSGFFHNKKRH